MPPDDRRPLFTPVRAVGYVCRMSQAPKSATASAFTAKERDAVLEFWFGFSTFKQKERDAKRRSDPPVDGERQSRWWKSSDAHDRKIRETFGALHARLSKQPPAELWAQLEGAEEAVACIIVLDQFSRQIYRDEAEAFAQDALARNICKRALLAGYFETVEHPLVPLFGLMPLMHSEDAQDQARSLDLFERLAMTIEDGDPAIPSIQGSVRAAREHKKVIDTFGRFPKRNPALGRVSTAKEKKHQQTEGPV